MHLNNQVNGYRRITSDDDSFSKKFSRLETYVHCWYLTLSLQKALNPTADGALYSQTTTRISSRLFVQIDHSLRKISKIISAFIFKM